VIKLAYKVGLSKLILSRNWSLRDNTTFIYLLTVPTRFCG
jgi:hypothetical protein